jgi:hypothetical protein
MTAGELALHVASEPGVLVETARRGGVDFGAHQSPAAARSVNHILAVHDASVERVVTVLTEPHHRGQLSVCLRLLDVAVAPIYGPSADENPFAQPARVG